MAPRRSYGLKFKLEVVDFAENNSVEAAGRKFNVSTSTIRDWKKQKAALVTCVSQNEETKHKIGKRVSGGGRKLLSEDLETGVYDWVVDARNKGLRVSIRSIQEKGKSLFPTLNTGKSFAASRGWVTRFIKRNGLTLRKRTTVAQKDPPQLHEKLVSYLMYASKIIEENKISPSRIIAMDETSLWFDMISNTTVDFVGAKSVTLKSTGNEKAHATVVLSAKGDGSKLKPYIVFKQSIREVKALSVLKDVVVVSSLNGWMNDHLTKDWISRVYGKFSFGPRVLAWDSYKCHISETTKEHLKEFNTKMIVIPGGCTKYLQAPDVSWNKPFKSHLAESYDKWLSGSENKMYTKGGNLKAPSKAVLVKWVEEAWNSISTELIKKSFKVCGLTTKHDGTEDNEIHCLKQGQPCSEAKALLDVCRMEQRVLSLQLEEDEEQTEENEIVVDVSGEESSEHSDIEPEDEDN